MKKIGLISDKKSKKVFFLPKAIEKLTASGIIVNIPKNYGKNIGIEDNIYFRAGAKVWKDNKTVIKSSDIICKTNAFNKKDLGLMRNKIAITMANYLANVDMLYEMMKDNIQAYAWGSLNQNGSYVFFPQLEKIKGRHAALTIEWALANKGLGISSANAEGIDKPRILILNATWAAYEAICALLANNMDVTLLDNDIKYCNDLINSDEIRKLCAIYKTKVDVSTSDFETMMKLFATHNGFIYTSTDPFNKTKPRITTEMAKAMPKGSVLVDAACENGYGFQFQKNFTENKIDFVKLENVVYSCVSDITDLYPMASSQIISNNSIEPIKDLACDKTDALNDILVCKDGKCQNQEIKKQLNLY